MRVQNRRSPQVGGRGSGKVEDSYASRPNGCLKNLGVLLMSVLITRALLLGSIQSGPLIFENSQMNCKIGSIFHIF